ncbi:hypothetical protein MLD38_035121 [Melastoma candidum]|uniref:Uncharacterized protein n=1 Tax=Melastoma candidum TaxID=119954 RepID=A0ACB9MBU3_9MYRT|nr:hypothetical protein MLD38_035121 [Melastoma candidum]
MSISHIQDVSLVEATGASFLRLFDYIQGKKDYSRKVEMTAHIITQAFPSDDTFFTSSFIVSFFVPKENPADTPQPRASTCFQWIFEKDIILRSTHLDVDMHTIHNIMMPVSGYSNEISKDQMRLLDDIKEVIVHTSMIWC